MQSFLTHIFQRNSLSSQTAFAPLTTHLVCGLLCAWVLSLLELCVCFCTNNATLINHYGSVVSLIKHILPNYKNYSTFLSFYTNVSTNMSLATKHCVKTVRRIALLRVKVTLTLLNLPNTEHRLAFYDIKSLI